MEPVFTVGGVEFLQVFVYRLRSTASGDWFWGPIRGRF